MPHREGSTGLNAGVNVTGRRWRPIGSSLLPLQHSWLRAFSRLDMHEHIPDALVTFLHRALHSMRNAVALAHGNIAVHADVKIDIILKAHLANAWFFNCFYAIDGIRRFLYNIDISQ